MAADTIEYEYENENEYRDAEYEYEVNRITEAIGMIDHGGPVIARVDSSLSAVRDTEAQRFNMVHESNPETPRVVNPYASSLIATEASSDPASLNIPAWIAIVCCVVSLGLWLLMLIVSLPYGHPSAPPLIEIVGFIGMFMVLPGLGLAGAVSMLKRQRYGLCVAAACVMMVPLLGPCFGLTLPVGIWAIVLLRRQPIRDSFSRSIERFPYEFDSAKFDSADDALTAASTLDTNGDWDAAIALYRIAADRWPEHATYIDNCIKDIERKKTASSRTAASERLNLNGGPRPA